MKEISWGKGLNLYTLENQRGTRLTLSYMGCTVVCIMTADGLGGEKQSPLLRAGEE